MGVTDGSDGCPMGCGMDLGRNYFIVFGEAAREAS